MNTDETFPREDVYEITHCGYMAMNNPSIYTPDWNIRTPEHVAACVQFLLDLGMDGIRVEKISKKSN
jgi:hypothetical protein